MGEQGAKSTALAWAVVQDLYPGIFAFVMATGILSDAFFLLDKIWFSTGFLGINLVAFPVLLLATTVRALCFSARFWRDLTDPRLIFSFFTIVASANVVGAQLFLRGYYMVATALWLGALVLWVILSYFSFALLIFNNDQRGASVMHGGWLIAIVSTQSLVLLGTLLAPRFGSLTAITFVGVHALWGIGITFYGIFVTLFSHRIFFLRVSPEDVMPLFWVVMGAAAISTNSGSVLIVSTLTVPFLTALRPFIEGATLVLWAWGTWWIPLLVLVGVWKHIVHRVPLTYHPMYWSLVFPLGMYSVASYRLSLAAEFPPLAILAHSMIWVALGAWILTMMGWAVHSLAALRAWSPRYDVTQSDEPPRPTT